MFSDLKDKVVVVTGGITGIGGAASVGFAAQDALERKDFASRRLLKAVSAELAQRMVEREGPHKIHHRWKNNTNP